MFEDRLYYCALKSQFDHGKPHYAIVVGYDRHRRNPTTAVVLLTGGQDQCPCQELNLGNSASECAPYTTGVFCFNATCCKNDERKSSVTLNWSKWIALDFWFIRMNQAWGKTI